MIKENKTRPLFHPSFGSRPARIVGRDKEIDDFMMRRNGMITENIFKY